MSDYQCILPFSNLNDSDFINVLKENIFHQFPLSIIDNLKFNRYNFSDGESLNDHVLREPICNYHFCDTIMQSIFSPSLKLLAYNISSLPLHFEIS